MFIITKNLYIIIISYSLYYWYKYFADIFLIIEIAGIIESLNCLFVKTMSASSDDDRFDAMLMTMAQQNEGESGIGGVSYYLFASLFI